MRSLNKRRLMVLAVAIAAIGLPCAAYASPAAINTSWLGAGAIVVSAIVAATIPHLTRYFIGRRQDKRAELERKLKDALNDLQYYMALEQFYVRHLKEQTGESYKNRIRRELMVETDLALSGRFDRNRIARTLDKLT
ncbi:hypothetical protein IC617_08920 [Neiella sp. HB171785]|uniref:Uncharacterized protein n=1 Tax=Neiella litorisoli TaxID=2771431 RepID=A0A8J6UEK3_9GAMM|nr:hypothetical protein [Neiella litorisoli]MBD1389549.1 hypothetical protein [Neiella litorisoli]